jgi:hypothetical protein
MKSFSTLFVLLGAVSATTITALPSFAQTTPVAVTGGSLAITNNLLTGVVSINSGANILTSVGPISISSGTITNATTQAGTVVQNGMITDVPSRADQVGDSFDASGTASGALSGNTLNNVNYVLTGTISSLVFSPSGNVQPTSSQVDFALNGGSFSLPTALVNSLSGTTAVPVTGGSLSVADDRTGVLSLNPTSILTSVGTISISSGTVTNGRSQNGGVLENGIVTVFPSRSDAIGDSASIGGVATGTLSGRLFSDANYAVTGTISGFTGLDLPVRTTNFSLNGGSISLPTSLVSSLSGSIGTGSIGTANNIPPIASSLQLFINTLNRPLTDRELQFVREILSSQPTPPQSNRARSNNIAPPGARVSSDIISSLGNSRIGLGAW